MEACKLSSESCTLRASDTACITADPGCAISWPLPDASCCRAWFGWRNGSFSKVSEESVEYGPQQNARLSQSSDSCVTFLYLEYEDLIAVLFIAPVSFFVGSFFDREFFGIPMKLVLQWRIPVVTILLLLAFKYGKPRGYLR